MEPEFANLLSATFTVEAIMTPAETLFTWPVDAAAGGPWTEPEAAGFDLVPAVGEEETEKKKTTNGQG